MEPEVDADADASAGPNPPTRRASTPTRSGKATRRDYTGCGLWALGFLVLVLISFAVGVVLRPDTNPNQGPDAVSLARSVGGDSSYRLVGRTDETEDPCVTLLRGDEEVTGQCGVALSTETGQVDRYAVTSSELKDGTTVVFGPVPRQAETVRLDLSDGSQPEVAVRRSDAAGLSWFTYETDQTVAGPAEMLDGNGSPVPTPR